MTPAMMTTKELEQETRQRRRCHGACMREARAAFGRRKATAKTDCNVSFFPFSLAPSRHPAHLDVALQSSTPPRPSDKILQQQHGSPLSLLSALRADLDYAVQRESHGLFKFT